MSNKMNMKMTTTGNKFTTIILRHSRIEIKFKSDCIWQENMFLIEVKFFETQKMDF